MIRPDRRGLPPDVIERVERGLKGDVLFKGLGSTWRGWRSLITDVRVTFPDGGGNMNKSTKELLQQNELEKRVLLEEACHAAQRDFQPFVTTTDGAMGRGARALLEALAYKLASKWGGQDSVILGYTYVRMSVAIAKATSD
jgi:hypothetical protein